MINQNIYNHFELIIPHLHQSIYQFQSDVLHTIISFKIIIFMLELYLSK